MSATVEAIYEGGVLRLLEPVALTDGARVRVTLVESSNGSKKPTPDPREVARILAEIAALSEPSGGEETASRDHDRILYGEDRAR